MEQRSIGVVGVRTGPLGLHRSITPILHHASRPAPELEIRLLGAFEVRAHGSPQPPLRSAKARWLLALLVLQQGRPVHRDWLAGLLWPDSSESRALYSLRRRLTELRQALGEQAVRLHAPTPRTLSFDLVDATVDVLAFDQAIAQGGLDQQAERLRAAVELYRGALLPECMEEWVLPERSAREEAYLAALESLAQVAMAAGQPRDGARLLRQAVVVDPLRESAHRGLMEALAADGDLAAALLTYRELRLTLHHELNAEPDPETKALYERLRAGARARAARSAAAPGPRTLPGPAAAAQLPRPLTALVGRDEEVAELRACLAGARLVTLTGTGGVGKTRLAIQVAEDVTAEFEESAWFADLAPLSDPGLVAATVARALRLPEAPGRPPEAALADSLRERELLLVLDNCEHLLAACAGLVAGLLQQCPRLRLLATSRQPLGLPGEVVRRVPSLSLPPAAGIDPDEKGWISCLMEYDAVRLFVERASQAERTFRATAENLATIARVCRRLDGIPLAIELAAARTRALTVDQIAARLDDRFRLLTGARAGLPRQQTLRATLEWSYTLLSEPERALLRGLSVFRAGWTLEAAEQVCGVEGAVEPGLTPGPSPQTSWRGVTEFAPSARCTTPGGTPPRGRTEPPGVESSVTPLHEVCGEGPGVTSSGETAIRVEEVMDLLAGLVDKSLVMMEERDGRARYRLLESTQEFAGEELRLSGEALARRERHVAHYLRLVEQARQELEGADLGRWLDRLEPDRDNLRAALEWSLSGSAVLTPGPEIGLRLATALAPFWRRRGPVAEGLQGLERALALDPAPTEARALGLRAAGELASAVAGWARAREFHLEVLELYEALRDDGRIADALYSLSFVAFRQEDLMAARSFGERSLAIYRELNDSRRTAWALARLGHIACAAGDPEPGRGLLGEGLALARASADPATLAPVLHGLGVLAYGDGDLPAARGFHSECLAIHRESGNTEGVAWSLNNLGDVALAEGHADDAATLLHESLCLFREPGHREGIAECLRGLARLACARSCEPEAIRRAVRLYGAQHALRTASQFPVMAMLRQEHEASLAAAQAALGEAGYAAAFAQGAAMPLEEAIALALSED